MLYLLCYPIIIYIDFLTLVYYVCRSNFDFFVKKKIQKHLRLPKKFICSNLFSKINYYLLKPNIFALQAVVWPLHICLKKRDRFVMFYWIFCLVYCSHIPIFCFVRNAKKLGRCWLISTQTREIVKLTCSNFFHNKLFDFLS